MFLVFKNGVKSIQTAGYNGARTVNSLCWHAVGKWLACNVLDTGYIMAKWLQYWWILMEFSTFKGLQYVPMDAPFDVNASILVCSKLCMKIASGK